MNSERQATLKATGFIILSSCGFGSLSTLAVLVARAGLPLMPAMVWRYLLAGLILALALRQKIFRATDTRHALQLMLIGGAGQSVITFLSLYALKYLPVGPLAFLFYTYPAWVAVLSAMLGKEALTLVRAIALTLAMAGITVIVGRPSTSSLNMIGVLLALGTAFLYALYLPVLHHAQKGISATASSFYLICGVFIAFFFGSVATGTMQMPPSAETWRLVLMLALFSTVIAFATLVAGLRVLGPVRTSIIATIEPFFTVVLGVVFIGEKMSRTTILGGLMIACAVILLQITAKDPAAAEAVA